MKTESTWARPHLETVARDVLEHMERGGIRPAADVLVLDSERYVSQQQFEKEKHGLFSRVPVLLALSCELKKPGDYKSIDFSGTPVVLVRDAQLRARAYLNACTHRGAPLVTGSGHRNRLTCPYHGWTFSLDGQLSGVPLGEYFDTQDGSHNLVEFPLVERAGLIWVTLGQAVPLEVDTFLNGLDHFLDIFEFTDWQIVSRKEIPGPNWKLAFDAHLEFYHLPVLHKHTFGPDSSNRALYYFWGPHQRLVQPRDAKESIPDDSNLFKLGTEPDHWTLSSMMLGEWILFPNVSINLFYNGGLGVLMSQVIPGADGTESTTVQTYLMDGEPDDRARVKAQELCSFLNHVVAEEDIPMSFRQQAAMQSGHLPFIRIGRNEFGVQSFHRWIDLILESNNRDLATLFERQEQSWMGDPLSGY